MRKFIKKPDITFAVIPGVGRLAEGQVLEGDQYAKFVPSLLVELLSEPAAAPAVAPPAPERTVEAPPPPSAPILLGDKSVAEAQVLVEKQPEPKPSPKPAPKPAPAPAKKPSKK